MSIGICRVQKIGAPKDIAGIQIHNRREREHSNTNPDIDRTRSAQNYTMTIAAGVHGGFLINAHNGVQGSEKPYNSLIDDRIKQGYTGKRTVRKDAVRCCEVLFTASGDFFEQHPDQSQRFFNACMAFAARRFGADNIIAATVHMDEDTPHMHLDFVPLTADGRLSAKSVLGGRKEMQQLQDDFFEQVGKQFGLERGNRADLADPDADQPRKHLTTRQLKAETATQLAEQERQIEKQSSRLSSYGEQIQEMETLLDQAERAYHEALAGRAHAENDAMFAEERAKQADTRAESVEARLHAAETKLNEVNAQCDAAAQQQALIEDKLKPLKEELKAYQELEVSAKAFVVEKKKVPFTQKVTVSVEDMERLEEQAKAYRVNQREIKNIRERQKELDANAEALKKREFKLKMDKEDLAVKESSVYSFQCDVNAMHHRQLHLNTLLENAEKSVSSLTTKNKSLETDIKDKDAEIEKLRKALLDEREKAMADKQSIEERLRKEQEQEIERRAAELTSKRIKEMFGDAPESRSKRLEGFCEKIRLKDGRTVLDVFEEQEERLRGQSQRFTR